MKILLFLILPVVLPIVATATGARPEAAAAPTAEQQMNIDALIHDLMDEKFQVREQASKELWELGDTALPALEKATKSSYLGAGIPCTRFGPQNPAPHHTRH